MSPDAPDETTRSTHPDPEANLEPGTKVEVRRKFDDKWARGFAIASVAPGGYRLRRLSDGQDMPVDFPADVVRREKKNKNWWY